LRALDSTIAEIRTISHLLHPPDLELMGLRASLAWYVQGFRERTGIQTDFEAPDELPTLPAAVSTVIFRVAQECLTNIHKHAPASRVTLRLVIGDNQLQFEIIDNRKGVPNLDSCRQGVGILGMQERIAELNGTMRIESGHGAGSSVYATIPLLEGMPAPIPSTYAAKNRAIRILVVDDHPAIRHGVRTVVTGQPDIIVCGEASNTTEAVQLASKLSPDVMILDLKLGDQNGWSVVRELQNNQSATKILIYSFFEERYFTSSAYRAGCAGALSKNCNANLLIEAIRTIHAGGKFFLANTQRNPSESEVQKFSSWLLKISECLANRAGSDSRCDTHLIGWSHNIFHKEFISPAVLT